MKKIYTKIYEDEQVLLVNKPSQILTIGDRFDPLLPNLRQTLREVYGDIFVVHRLDRDTSGVICFAKNADAHRNLSLQFERRETEKTYWALLKGELYQEDGEIEAALAPHPTRPGRMHVYAKGKPSLTRFKVLERFKGYTLVEASIGTGRMHQIRVHFAHLGYPLVGDPLYGDGKSFYVSDVKRRYNLSRKEDEERPLLSRCALHAYSLGFAHPTTEERVDFECTPPKDLRATLNQLRKWAAKD